ncbi:MAG: hypothetical protein GKS01_05900 [Alphaproteobacteria bacterium]|nr:hypothetical protein [Alphaproteobacteria bacterium]
MRMFTGGFARVSPGSAAAIAVLCSSDSWFEIGAGNRSKKGSLWGSGNIEPSGMVGLMFDL